MENTDNKKMAEGVDMILGFTPYNNFEVQDECDHVDDGFIYGETLKKVTLHCDKCGDFYEQEKA